jgi:uncharacterized protein
MTTCILFIQGGGEGAHDEDALLADALKRALGPGYDVRFPRMPDEGEPDAASWKQQIASELSHLTGKVILVGHSLGGSILLRYLSEEKVDVSIAAAYFLAAPAFDGERWSFDDLKLSADAPKKLTSIPRLVFFHCRDDEIAPFAHLALHGERIPRAITRAFDTGGHQFDNDLTAVAADIRANPAS